MTNSLSETIISVKPFHCSAVLSETCPDLESPSSGSVTISSDGSLTRAVFDCLPDYELVGAAELSCQSNGSWDFTTPLCGTMYQTLVNKD